MQLARHTIQAQFFYYLPIIFIFTTITASLVAGFFYKKSIDLNNSLLQTRHAKDGTDKKLRQTAKAFDDLQHQNQYVINQNLQKEINSIHTTYKKAVIAYEKLLDLKTVSKNTTKDDASFADALTLLSMENYASADAELNTLSTQIDSEQSAITSAFTIPNNIPVNNAPPGAGFSSQQVNSDVGTFLVDIIAADLSSTRVVIDTASDSDCGNNCPVLPLSTYVSRSGAYAGINGNFFCPASYPSCAGKTNSFDLLVMNKNKHYFNSANNVYSTNPAVIFGNGWVRFVGRALEWGRDTSVDGVISNFPMLVQGNNIVFSSSDDPKFNGKGPRGFVANKGATVYIGFVLNATMSDAAHVMKTMNMDNAMNLDEGGSTALWYGGYQLGPGRDLADALLFIRK